MDLSNRAKILSLIVPSRIGSQQNTIDFSEIFVPSAQDALKGFLVAILVKKRNIGRFVRAQKKSLRQQRQIRLDRIYDLVAVMAEYA